jgi:hypothetical protein
MSEQNFDQLPSPAACCLGMELMFTGTKCETRLLEGTYAGTDHKRNNVH